MPKEIYCCGIFGRMILEKLLFIGNEYCGYIILYSMYFYVHNIYVCEKKEAERELSGSASGDLGQL